MSLVELNVGGIVAAVLVTLILLGLLVFGIWFAYSRGYFDSKYLASEALPPPVPTLGSAPELWGLHDGSSLPG